MLSIPGKNWDPAISRSWLLAEAKYRQTAIGDALTYFQKQTGAPFAFQVVVEADYVAADCFRRAGGPIVVPARTFLSQLL